MKKTTKNLLILGSTSLSVPTLAILSAKCTDEKNTKQKLNEIAKNLNITIDTTKYTIKEALEIKNYNYNLSNEYKLDVKITEKNNKIEFIYKVTSIKDKISSDEIIKNFSNFKVEDHVNEQEEINNIAKNLDITIDSNKYKIDDGLKISNYNYELDNNKYILNLISLEKTSEKKVILKFKISKKDNSLFSNEETRIFEFNNLEENKWTETPKKVNGLNFDKYSDLANFYNLNSGMSIKEVKEILINKTKDNVEISNIQFDSYDESEGNLKLKFDLKINNEKIDTKLTTISGFKKIDVFELNYISVKLNKEKLIKENKKPNDIAENEILEYIKITFKNNENQDIDIVELSKKLPENYSFENLKFSDTKKNSVNFSLNIKYKKKESSKSEEIINKKLIAAKKEFNNLITIKDNLNYIIENKITKKEIENKANKYASSYLNFYRDSKKVAHDFLENAQETYDGEGIEFANETLTVDDHLGTVEFQFNLSITKDGETHYSNYKTYKFSGFKTLNEDMAKEFLLVFKPDTPSSKKIIEKVKKEYQKNPNTNLKLDKEWIKNNTSNGNSFIFLRFIEDNTTNNHKLEIRNNNNLRLILSGDNIENCIINNTQIKNPKNNSIFEIEHLHFEFESITFEEQENRIYFFINYKLNMGIHSESKINIQTEGKVRWFFDK